MVRARAVVSGSPQWSTRDAVDTNPILPDYSGANVSAIVPGLLIGSSLMAGSFLAQRFVLKMEAERFRLLMDGLLVLSGLTMIWAALA